MPIYEYAATDGTKIELIRPMADADKPVTDPDGKGRTFTRVMSTVAVGGAGAGGASAGAGAHVHSGMCGCGKKRGSCGGGGA
jgi:predicted nucleic acid-binding Zn ribbon protein